MNDREIFDVYADVLSLLREIKQLSQDGDSIMSELGDAIWRKADEAQTRIETAATA
jgi:hypothetical protein